MRIDELTYDREGLSEALGCDDPAFEQALFNYADSLRSINRGDAIYLRGLVEISNLCRKNCLYCGIRHDNSSVGRYFLSDDEVLNCASRAQELGFGSIVLQGGERCDTKWTERIEKLVSKIKALDPSGSGLGITLSLGEQSRETFKRWFDAGAHRYLLRIESSDPVLYSRIHPANSLHSYSNRRRALDDLKEIGYLTGTGVMIGIPGQTLDSLAGDLIFLRDFGAPMVGMGPYIPHNDTPLGNTSQQLIPPPSVRLKLSLKMVALLRLIMPSINIAATTALEALDPRGREMALSAGANVIMPNMTPPDARSSYNLYEHKPFLTESLPSQEYLSANNRFLGLDEWGGCN